MKIPKHRMPTLDDITPQLSKVRVFTICDAKDGFLQIRLDDTSSKLTTFHTPFGRYKWSRLPFGINSAPEEFQRRTLEIIEGSEGVHAVNDDCVIIRQGDTQDQAILDHDRNLTAFLRRCRERKLKLNREKLQFRLESVKYQGHILTSEGLCPDPEKITAIQNMPRPKDKAEIRRFLGMVTYLSKFIPQLSETSQPLRDLTKQDKEFLWSTQHDKAFNILKEKIASPPCLKYFDVDDECSLETDASEYGLGAVVTQQGHPIAYASHTLNETERRYSQIEKECLALVFGCQRFDHYLVGREKVTAYCDHKPLETILARPINAAPKRIQRMMLRLQRYRLNVVYKKGAQMFISDHLSRSPLSVTGKEQKSAYEIFTLDAENRLYDEITQIDVDIYIYHNVSDITLQKVKRATEEDQVLQNLASTIIRGFPDDKSQLEPDLKIYWPYRDELSAENGIVYRGVRVVIPASLRNSILSTLHSSHLGSEATLRKAKDSVYWPSIHNDITNMCEQCQPCQANKPSNCREPMKSQPVPKRRWQICSTDLFTFQNRDHVVVVDNLTKYFEFEEMKDTTGDTVIQKIKQICARNGVCEVLISDNGPQYINKDFRKFAQDWSFRHYSSDPHHPRGNGF